MNELVKWIERVVVFTKSFCKSTDKILVLRGISLSFSLIAGACETQLSSFYISCYPNIGLKTSVKNFQANQNKLC